MSGGKMTSGKHDMATIPARPFTSRTGDPFIIRSAWPNDAMDLLAHAKAVAQESDYLLTEPDEFKMTEDEERQWVQDHVDSPARLACWPGSTRT
jgi:hypothetical protein